MTTTVAIIILLVVVLVPLIVWQVRASREQKGYETEPNVVDRVDVHDLHRPGDFL